MTPEGKVKKQITDYLESLHKEKKVWYQRREAIGFSYKKGVPDLYAVCKGYHIEIEVKRGIGGELSTMQEKFRSECKNYGMIYILADSLYEVKNVIDLLLSE